MNGSKQSHFPMSKAIAQHSMLSLAARGAMAYLESLGDTSCDVLSEITDQCAPAESATDIVNELIRAGYLLIQVVDQIETDPE